MFLITQDQTFVEFIMQPWHWSVSGTAIALVMFLMLYLGKRFGISTSFVTACNIAGAGKFSDYFKFDWKQHQWLLTFVAGSIIGGAIASNFLASPTPLQVAPATIEDLKALGVAMDQRERLGFIPTDLFSFKNLFTVKGLILMVGGGFLVGFGTRWAGGCTSGHAISGLSNLQLPSLIAVIGFFIGGLLVTHLLFPFIFSL